MTISFKDFVMSQPANRTIKHRGGNGGWAPCAVGDYCIEVLNKSRNYANSKDICVYSLIADKVLYECLNADGKLLVKDDAFYRVARRETQIAIITTYGDIQEYYQGNLKLTVEYKI